MPLALQAARAHSSSVQTPSRALVSMPQDHCKALAALWSALSKEQIFGMAPSSELRTGPQDRRSGREPRLGNVEQGALSGKTRDALESWTEHRYPRAALQWGQARPQAQVNGLLHSWRDAGLL